MRPSDATSPAIIPFPGESLGWSLHTDHTTYALGVTAEGVVLHHYWGARLPATVHFAAQLPPGRSAHESPLHRASEEFPPWGGLRYGETTLKVTYADGTRDVDLRFSAAQVDEDAAQPTLHVTLRDPQFPLSVTLHFVVDAAHDAITRSATITNDGPEPLVIERALSAVWHLPPQIGQRHLHTLAGQWSGETRQQRQPLVAGTVLIEARRGISSMGASPWCGIDTGDGGVYTWSLAWSGNWQMRVTTDITGHTAIAAGLHEHDFAWRLASGASFTTPDCVGIFAPEGWQAATQRLHRHVRAHILPQPAAAQPRPVLYNSWEATFFAVDEAQQMALATRAAEIGVELFVMDDGWFQGRHSDTAGLGDWFPDTAKFPHGLRPLAQHVRDLGMHFGLWVEPEMVNPDSDLFRAHPDWIYHFPKRQPSEARNQLVLNLGREDVREYLFAALHHLLTDVPITFLKWDMNRPIAEPGWPSQPEHAREIWVRHTRGVYDLMQRLRDAHPDLTIESCASGGGRADLGILRYTDQIWVSDNTDALTRLTIQAGFSQMFPARVMEAWVTDIPNLLTGESAPLRFRAHVAMLGALGIGGNLADWSAEERTEMAHYIATYKRLRPLVQEGDATWQTFDEGVAVHYVATDASAAVLFVFRPHDRFREALPPIRVTGLPPDAPYHVTQEGQADATLLGAQLAHEGIVVPLPAEPYASAIILCTRLT